MQLDEKARDLNLLVWITKTTREGDTNARIGIAEQISDTFAQLDMPTEFCTPEQVKKRLLTANLITPDNTRWPDVVIGPCFHIPYMQVIKQLSGGKTIVVALRPPVRGLPIKASKHDIDNTDIIVSYPYHNNDNLPNVLLCDSVANRITEKHLCAATKQWAREFVPFLQHGTVIGLLMGGDVGDKRRIFSPTIARSLGNKVNQLAEKMGAAMLLSVSARTSQESKEALCSQITVPYYFYDPKLSSSNNPYFAILGSANYLVVTADSISMCCEAASSGKPVYIFHDPAIVESTHEEIVSRLIKKGYARSLHNVTDLTMFAYKPTNSAEIIAERIYRIWAEKDNECLSILGIYSRN